MNTVWISAAKLRCVSTPDYPQKRVFLGVGMANNWGGGLVGLSHRGSRKTDLHYIKTAAVV